MNTVKRKLNIFRNRKVKKKLNDFFGWIKGAELIELKSCDIKEDPVRPELNIVFRRSYGRKIFGVKYKKKYVLLCVLDLQMKFQLQLKNQI